MYTGDFPLLNQLAENHVCADHRDKLSVVAYLPDGKYALWCATGHYPDTIDLKQEGEIV